MTLFGVRVAVGPGPDMVSDSATVPEKLLKLVTVRVVSIELPTIVVTV